MKSASTYSNEVDFSLTMNSNTVVDLKIPASLLPLATKQRDSFLATQTATPEDEDTTPLLPVELTTKFINYIAQDGNFSPQHHQLIQILSTYLEDTLLAGTNIHALAASELHGNDSHQRNLIATYLSASLATGTSRRPSPALLDAQSSGSAKIVGLFGGQGNNKAYFDELRSVWETYRPPVGEYIDTLSETLKTLSQGVHINDAQDREDIKEQYPHGLDVSYWLRRPEETPSNDYLITAPVSFPLIGLLQLAHVKTISMSLGVSPSSLFSRLAGHSQGVVVAGVLSTVSSSNWEEDYLSASLKAIKILFSIGCRSQQIFAQDPLSTALSTKLEVEYGLGQPTPMLSISGSASLSRSQLERLINQTNARLPSEKHVHLALINSIINNNFVVSGPERTLAALVQNIRAISASSTDASSQGRVPFSQRKPTPSMRFLPITVPCHCDLLDQAVPLIEADLQNLGVSIKAGELKVPVNQLTAAQLEEETNKKNIVPLLVRMITSQPVNWVSENTEGFEDNLITHIIDFGPGLNSGVGSLSNKNLVGRGVRVLVAGKLSTTTTADPQSLGTLSELFQPVQQALVQPPKWSDLAPSLICTFASRGKAILNTPFSRLLHGLPPIMVGGMTPTTTSPTFVAAVMNAGYHIEFACGGYHSAASLKSALTQLHSLINPGRSIALNVIYVAPRQIAWQIPLIKTLRGEGMPISSVTVGGGVPSVEVATGWIDDLGMEFLSFKPGSVGGIRQVVEIAKARPTFPVVLQWTGGRGGGHHSAEDMYAPILETYAEIRANKNIVLLAGGGLGSAEDVAPWFTGDWVRQSKVSGKGLVKMPFDGVLLGSRVMVTKEARTSLGSKEQIAAAKGVENQHWEGTYKVETGGILSVVSEMGEQIHVVATRGAKFWAEMDKLVFSVDKKKRKTILDKNRAMIIKGLNRDFQKVWFGRKMDGSGRDDCEVADMTYEEVVRRLVQLMFVADANGKEKGRWIDKSYVGFLAAFLERVEERLGDEDSAESVVSEEDCRHDPLLAVKTVLGVCPGASTTLLCSEDVDYFFQLCRRAGQKPVPFVPALDDSFETWFKKDSLWQSEDVEAVVGQDAGRTFILHGPVAAQHTCKVNEPVGEVLHGINQGVVEHLLQGVVASSLPYEEIIGMANQSQGLSDSVELSGMSGDTLRQVLAAGSTWKSALLNCPSILRGRDMVDNPVRRLFDSTSFNSSTAQINLDSVTVFAADKRPIITITKDADNVIEILPFTYTTRGNQPVTLQLKFQYRPDTPYAPIWEVTEHRNERICAMYRQLWQGEGATKTTEAAAKGPEFSVFEDSFIVDSSRVRTLNRAIGYSKAHQHEKVPMDFAMVACWSPICKALLQDPIQGDVLNLVHLSNAYEAAGQDIKPLEIGDQLSTRAYVNSITIEDSGKVVEVICEMRRQSQSPVIMTVRSNFLFRGQYTDYSSTFARKTEPRYEMHMSSEADIAVLATKPWFRLDNQNGNTLDNLNLTDLTLEFHLQTSTKWLSKSVYSTIDTTGRAYVRSEAGDLTPVATILHRDFECKSNSVLSYLSRWGQIVSSEKSQPLSTDPAVNPKETMLTIQIPASNESYSVASGDFNPIHTSPIFASLVSLPGTITHGMYLSAAVRSLLETHLTNSTPSRIRSYSVSFVGMVLPNDSLTVSFSHTAMKHGNLVITISVSNPTTGQKVLSGEAILSQPSTTVIFTGQGSQEPGMGMSLYQSSPVARAIWDRAESYFQSQFGLSILQIVRQNPKSITVHFGGVKGRMLRQNYLSMYYEVPSSSPTTDSSSSQPQPVRKPIFPDITPTTKSYTHSSPNGLLFATQFAQPALTIMEMAAYKDLQSKDVLPADCHFAGHSLGEYAALLSITDFMPFENLLYFVFWRGMTMQSAVERDDKGRSKFAMVAVDPSRIGKQYKEKELRGLVKKVMDLSGWFVEIVNLNIKDRQYVCAGDLRALDLLQRVCDKIAAEGGNNSGSIKEEELITKFAVKYGNIKAEEIALVRGKATVPLSGVDVPFHSSFLRPRIEAFRRTLQDSLNMERLKPERLVGKYVPNVTGTPFELSREYLENVAAITGSERLQLDVLGRWEDWESRILREGARREVGVAA